MKIKNSILAIFVAATTATFSVSADDSTEVSSIGLSLTSEVREQIRLLGADEILCFSNEEFKADVRLSLITQIGIISNLVPGSTRNLQVEECVNVTFAKANVHEANRAKLDEAVAQLSGRFENANSVDIEVMGRKIEEQPSSVLFQTSGPSSDVPETKTKAKVSITWRTVTRAAVAGAAGAGLLKLARPIINKAASGNVHETKGSNEFLSIGQGAIVGVIADVVQRLNGAIDDSSIFNNNMMASALASMVHTRDPNLTGVAIIFSLSKTDFVMKQMEKLTANTPKKLDNVWALAMIGGLAILSHGKANEKWIANNHVQASLAYGALAYHFSAKYENETASFIVMNTISLLDELCDAVTKVCKGRFSTRDMFANALGAYAGVKLATWLPPGLFINFYRGVAVSYFRKW